MQPPCRSRKFAFGSWHQRAIKTAVTATAVIQAQSKGQPGGEPLQISTRRLACTCFAPPLLIANNKDPDENLLQQLPLRHSSGTFFMSSPKYSSRIGPADRETQLQHQSRRTMRKQHDAKTGGGNGGLIRLSGVNNKRSQKRTCLVGVGIRDVLGVGCRFCKNTGGGGGRFCK